MDDEKKVSSILKEYSGFAISLIGLCGTIFAFMVQAIVITYEISRYSALEIPLYFIKQSNSLFDMIRMICLFISVVISIVVTVLIAFYKRHVDACMQLEQMFHTEKMPLHQYILWKINILMTVVMTLISVNQLVIALLVIQEQWKKTTTFCLLVICELSIAKFVVFFIVECRKDKVDKQTNDKESAPITCGQFEPYNCNDKERVVTRAEIREVLKKYKINHYLLTYKQTGLVMTISLAVVFLFVCVQITGFSNPINKTCQIVDEDTQTFVVLTTINDKCIVSPVNIKEDTEGENVLYVYNRKQAIMELSDLTYEIESFDRIELMDKQ